VTRREGGIQRVEVDVETREILEISNVVDGSSMSASSEKGRCRKRIRGREKRRKREHCDFWMPSSTSEDAA